MEFTPDDFKRMMFPVHEADMNVSFLTQFPELNIYDEFKAKLPPPLEINKIIKFICFVYDRYSPYRIKYKDLLQRKVIAIVDAGYPMVGKEFDPEIEDVIHTRDGKVASMIIAFLKMHNDNAYSHLVLVETLYFQKMRDVFIGGNEKISELNQIKKSLQDAQEELLMGDQSRTLVKSLNRFLNNDKIMISPERIAKSMKDKGIDQTVTELG